MGEKKVSPLYKVVKWLVKVFSPKFKPFGVENLPDEPSIIVANHCHMYGPISCELYFPGKRYTWCAGQMMHLKDVPAYAYQDFWSQKPKHSRWFYKMLSYIIAPLSVLIFNNADTIGVYRDTRIMSTFKDTIERLCEGAHVVVFPEHSVPRNNIICDFQDRFIDIAKMYYRKTGRELNFVPMYIAPKLSEMHLGKSIRFSADAPIDIERRRICEHLMNEITDIACGLPRHIVVPYNNVSKKEYPYNDPCEASKQ
ncbi:MAG: hypothetical protein E7456_02920 [Ruminococcaceae bacterium]|nr:hypothetical protein [Oscillospiraceae bacterium]